MIIVIVISYYAQPIYYLIVRIDFYLFWKHNYSYTAQGIN